MVDRLRRRGCRPGPSALLRRDWPDLSWDGAIDRVHRSHLDPPLHEVRPQEAGRQTPLVSARTLILWIDSGDTGVEGADA